MDQPNNDIWLQNCKFLHTNYNVSRREKFKRSFCVMIMLWYIVDVNIDEKQIAGGNLVTLL